MVFLNYDRYGNVKKRIKMWWFVDIFFVVVIEEFLICIRVYFLIEY